MFQGLLLDHICPSAYGTLSTVELYLFGLNGTRAIRISSKSG